MQYGDSCRKNFKLLVQKVENMDMTGTFQDPEAGQPLTDEQLLKPGGLPSGKTHPLNNVMWAAGGGFGRDEWDERQVKLYGDKVQKKTPKETTVEQVLPQAG